MKSIIKTMGLISILFNLLGCSGSKDNGELPPEVKEQMTKDFQAFQNRPIYKKLTNKIIDSIPDKDLLQVIFDNLSQEDTTGKNQYRTVMSWNNSKSAIYMIWMLEAEVNNGGYNQFYYNLSGRFYKHLPGALKLVGANKFADLTQRANNVFEKENAKITQHQDGTLEGFSKSYEDNPLDKFDNEFYALYKTENLQQVQVDYIRMHKIDFID